jgi:CDP-4-dehydro-6-deoxyglucose reductase/3-phenylpropionate/trans-cinnamate dioxygenase ferredoxin reductase subunit
MTAGTALDVRVAGTQIVFSCRPGETVLDAAERAGYALPYSCRKGVCTSCAATLTEGSAQVPGHPPTEAPADGVLLCRAVPRSPVEIAPTRIERSEPPTRRTMAATVHKISYPAPDVAVLALRYPIGKRVRFRAGQYLTVRLPDGDTRNYSMANPPWRNDAVSLHIRRVPGGRFSEGVLAGLRRGDQLTVELPFGEFTVDHDSTRPILLVVTGTGFAPAKSIIEDLIARRAARPVRLYWGRAAPATSTSVSSRSGGPPNTVGSGSPRCSPTRTPTGRGAPGPCTGRSSPITPSCAGTTSTPAATRR